MGYHLAGFEVVGVDRNPQPHFPFEFYQADAMTYPLEGFDAIHASPPCQGYTVARHIQGREHPMLIEPLRERLQGTIYIIENVPGAPLQSPLMLCGSMFNLALPDRGYLRRHRLFESNVPLVAPGLCDHQGQALTIFGGGAHKGRAQDTTAEERRQLMGMPWATRSEIAEAIPPVYTRWFGAQLLDVLGWEQT